MLLGLGQILEKIVKKKIYDSYEKLRKKTDNHLPLDANTEND